MIKVTDLEYFIFIAFTLKFGVKVCFPKAVALAGGICEPLLTCSSYKHILAVVDLLQFRL